MQTSAILNRIERMRKAHTEELELNEKEIRQLRSLIYGINKDGIRKYRTIREGPYLIVWRIK